MTDKADEEPWIILFTNSLEKMDNVRNYKMAFFVGVRWLLILRLNIFCDIVLIWASHTASAQFFEWVLETHCDTWRPGGII